MIYLTYKLITINHIIIIIGFIERKIDTNPLMRLSPRRESPGSGMGIYNDIFETFEISLVDLF